MKPLSLSLRLGLSVSMMGAALALIIMSLTYLALSLQLNLIAKNSLHGKIKQIEHSLNEDMDTNTQIKHPHDLQDIVLAHKNLNLSIYGVDPPTDNFIASEEISLPSYLSDIPATINTSFHSWTDEENTRYLTALKLVKLTDRKSVRVLLSLDRSEDKTLLTMSLKTALFSMPALLLLIGSGAWWITHRGLSPLIKFNKTASLITTRDLTHRISTDNLPQELSELAKTINFMLNRLNDGVQQLSQFSDDLSHELRSPISNLLGMAQVTLSRERPSEEYKTALECCIEELERVSRIVSDMLFLAQADHSASSIPFDYIFLEKEAVRVIDLFSIAAEEKQLHLNVDGAGIILGDRIMIQRAIYNLVSNAIEHSPTHSNVRLAIEARRNKVSLSVINSGEEIPAQHLPHLFERFYRVDQSRSRVEGGTGLGLAIVRSIMSLHGGTAEVSSTPEGTTNFSLNFPIVDR